MGGCECCKQPPDDVKAPNIQAFVNPSYQGGGPGMKPNDQEVLRFCSKVNLFQRLPQNLLPLLATAVAKREFPKSTVLMRQGDSGNEFFVIVSGSVSVDVDGKKVATLSSGDYVGEIALLRDEPRTATITAEAPVQAISITREKFQELGLNEKLEFPKRAAVAGGAERPLITKPASVKTLEDRKAIMNALRSNANLAEMVTLEDTKAQLMCDVAWEETVLAGQDVIQQGSDGDYFYIVKDGEFEILIAKEEGRGKSAKDAQSQAAERLGMVSKGGSFGELALLYFAPRAATVKAKMQSIVWVIDRDNFKRILAKSADDFAKAHVKYLEKADVFRELRDDEKMEVAKALVESNFSRDECVFEQGEKGTTFYILYDGAVSVIKDGRDVAQLRGTPDKVEIFGEVALLNAEQRSATIRVTSDTARTLAMDKASFELLLGPLSEIKNRGRDGGTSKVNKGGLQRLSVVCNQQAMARQQSGKQAQIYRKDLSRLGLLGCGGFGAVELVEHNQTKETYALKALSKGYIVKCGMKKGVMSEKNIQYMCDSEFVVRLYETYNGEQSLYFLLELALGGELYATYSRKGFHGSLKHAQFYIAGTVYSFDHLHEKKIIFRDLKPENLLLTDRGNIKLTDMGLAKVVVGKTYTTCGTPDYFAPELIASTGHTHAVDWWCLGVLTFELMTGHPPFESAAPMQIYSKVAKGINKVPFPPKLKGQCESFVKALCTKEPFDRLPMKKGGIENIQNHAWYQGFDWVKMKDTTLEPPYLPKVKSKKDIANFSARKEDMPPQVKYTDEGDGWDKDFATST